MASIDRYRPPREGYQPPSAAQPTAAAAARQSRSPALRREIPPPAPSPPTHTSRTSPPRPHSRRGLQSPRHEAPAPPPPEEVVRAVGQWFFTADEAKSTPSILDGLAPAEERLRRAKGVNFIYQAGVLLDLPQITLWVAGVFFHRFYMRMSMAEEKGGIHHYSTPAPQSIPRSKHGSGKLKVDETLLSPSFEQNIAATALFLANKTEENCRKTKDLIITVAKVAQKNSKLIIDEQSKEYWRWRDSILMYEELMLELLTFDLMVDNPYRCLFDLLERLGIVHNKHLRQSAWAFLNDACLTQLPLLMEARDVAISAIFFASVHTKQQIDDTNGQPWWQYLEGSEDYCVKAINLMAQFWEENPLKKQNPAIASPAFQLDSTRRRGETMPSQADTLSSAAPTPLDLEHGAQSPRGKANGGASHVDKDALAKKRHVDDSQSTLREPDVSSFEEPHSRNGTNVGPSTPAKRKDVHHDGDSDADRVNKKKRLSDSDEGEVIES